MTSPLSKMLISLLLLIGIVSCFQVGEYLYPEEENYTISYIDFRSDGISYQIVELEGEPIFLLKNGEAVDDATEIDSVIYDYYLQTYYPSAEEIENLTGKIIQYNESRNDGQKFVGKEEYSCRSILFVDGRVNAFGEPVYCRGDQDLQLCNYSAMLMFQFLSSVATPPVSSWVYLLPDIKEFGYASYGMEDVLAQSRTGLEAAGEDESKMYTALNYIYSQNKTLHDYQSDMENNLFTRTQKKTCDTEHWCMCPDIEFDAVLLNEIIADAKLLMDKTIPFENYLDTSASLYTSSMARFEYVQVEKAVQNYNNAYISLQDAGSNSISLGNAALDYVSDNPLLENLTILESLHQTIPEDLELRNISTLNDDLALYRELIISVGDNALLLLTQYNETRDSKNLANSMVLVLQSKDLEPVSRKMLSLLENESGDLDAKFRGGLTKNELTVLQNNYTVLAREAQELLKSENEMPVAKALLVFREYARKVNNGIASFADASGSFSKKEVPSDSLFLGGFSILLFLSLSSIAFILFLWTISTFKFRIPKTTHILASAFICVVVILFMFSLLMYFFLGKTSTDATLPEFLLDFHSKNSTAIVLDLRNTTYSDSSAMASCALSLADTFSKSNKSWTVYTLTNTACTAKYAGRAESNSTMLVDDCLTYAENATSLFVLDYATNNEPPKFSVIYENKAEIKANLDYYESCPLVALFN